MDPVLTESLVLSADVTVAGNITSYTLKSLVGNTKYDTWIEVSTIKGSKKGFNHSFTTQKHGKYPFLESLKSLVGDTEYVIGWGRASTIKGSAEGANHTHYITT